MGQETEKKRIVPSVRFGEVCRNETSCFIPPAVKISAEAPDCALTAASRRHETERLTKQSVSCPGTAGRDGRVGK
jgi:hypothetical protein